MTKSPAERAAEAREKALQLEAEAVIADPDGHFPYKRDEAVKAGVSEEMADLSARLVAAQEARWRDPSEENIAAERELTAYVIEVNASRRPATMTIGADPMTDGE